MSKIKVIALYGKAGAGKDALLQTMMSMSKPEEAHEIISCTTRPPRENEIDHINYHFITVDDFTKMVLNGEMLEATEFRDWWYGTPISSLDPDCINIGVFNPAGIAAIYEDPRLDVFPIYVIASDKTRLLRQLNRENDPDVAEIIRRYQTDEKDFRHFECDYDIAHYTIRNEDSLEKSAYSLLQVAQLFFKDKVN